MFKGLGLSSNAKIICFIFSLPVMVIATYMHVSGYESMAWVNEASLSIFGQPSVHRLEIQNATFILAICIWIPSLAPAFVYDFFTGQGLFESDKSRRRKERAKRRKS